VGAAKGAVGRCHDRLTYADVESTRRRFVHRFGARPAVRSGLLSVALFVVSHRSLAETPPFRAEGPVATARLAEWLVRARALGIAQSRAWQRLLHYRPRGPRQAVSEVAEKRFFLAPNGARDPEAELTATLLAFAQPVAGGRENEHALCRFPARRRLLDDRLHFGEALPVAACPALAGFRAELDPEAVSMVYAANFLDNPASAFGHTFLRLSKHRPSSSTAPSVELDNSVEYTADPDTTNPVLYAFKGLTGMFPGVFRFHSFESKVHEYANGEARDLWQYDLNLSKAEIELLVFHLWELTDTHFDYYYLTKNCSYHALATLEAAVPRLDLIEHLNLVVLPRDTIKALFGVPGLVRGVRYYPSARSQLRARVSRFGTTPEASWPGRPGDARAPLSKVPIPTPSDKAPHRAHGSLRLTLGSGFTSQYESNFGTVGGRLALHDLADPPDGEPELSQLQFLDTRFRYNPAERAFTLDRLTFAELVALNPLTRYERALSWVVRAFGTRLHDAGCRDCFAHGLELSLGATVATNDEHVAVFVLASSLVGFSRHLDGLDGSFVRVGVGPVAGVRARVSSQVVAVVTATWSYLPGAHLKSTYDIRAALRGALAHDVAVGFEAAVQPLSVEGMLASYFYF